MDNDLTVITSFNLLVFAGNGLADDEITDELGVTISNSNEVGEIVSSFPKPKLKTSRTKKIQKVRKKNYSSSVKFS